ncbi:two-component sensor histidine kinase, partial [Arthrobacter stackebrandtii]
MLPRLKTSLRCWSRVALLPWATAALCVASLVANLVLYFPQQAIPASLLALQLAATLATVAYLALGARSISLRRAELAERMLKVQEDERQHLSREL